MEQPAISSDLIRGHIDTIILHTLIDGDKFAQQISDSIELKSDGEYKINQATLYSSLKRLETLKLVSSYWYDSESGGRRKYFKLTQSGKTSVETNLNSWSFSRSIIDKLMDCAPEPIYKTFPKEKVVEIPVESKVISTDKQTTQELNVATDNLQKTSPQPVKLQVYDNEKTQQEVNFRNVLNGLIKATELKKAPKEEIIPLEKEETPIIEDTSHEKLKFNETITSNDYNVHKANNSSKIDFGDLLLKSAKEGYKLKISSKDSGIIKGKILTNKLKFFASLITFLFVIAEFLIITLGFKTVLQFKTPILIVSALALSLFPVINLINYVQRPTKKSPKAIPKDTILTVTIIVFNLFLVTFAANLLCNVDFSNTKSVITYLIIPTLLYVDVIIYFISKYALSTAKFIKIKTSK